MVRQLGFKVNHVALDDLGAQNRLGQYDWDMNAMASGPRADIFLRFVRLMSDGPNPVLWGGIQDPELDAVIKAAVAETDEQTRKDLYLEAWDRVMDNYYTVVLGHAANTIAIREEVAGYEPGFTWSPNWATRRHRPDPTQAGLSRMVLAHVHGGAGPDGSGAAVAGLDGEPREARAAPKLAAVGARCRSACHRSAHWSAGALCFSSHWPRSPPPCSPPTTRWRRIS